MIATQIFKAYDIRAIYPSEMDEESIAVITKAIYTLFTNKAKKQNLQVVVGGDMRVSTPSLSKVVKETLVEMGANVIDVGLVSTPTFYFAVRTLKADAGIQISASHNPKEYNGMKIVRNTEGGLIKIGTTTGMDEIKTMAIHNNFPVTTTSRGSITQVDTVLNTEVENSIRLAESPEISPLKVVADAANAMGAQYLDALFKKLPCTLIKMNFELDGTFPAHQPDPLQFDTLIDLQKKVIDEKADLGIAPDGDGDRVFFIDEKGQVIPASMITALVAKELLSRHPGEKIAFDVRSTMTPMKSVTEHGGVPILTRVGHALITETMHKENVLFAGESSGHYYFRETGFAESLMPVILIVLSVISREKKPISELIEPLRGSYESGEINFKLNSKEDTAESITKLKETFGTGTISELDGVCVDFPEWRFSVRSSNTEPLLRLNIEAKTKELLDTKKQILISQMQSLQNPN